MGNIYISLEKQKLPGIQKITKIPGVEKIKTKKSGNLFLIKYFLYKSDGPKMIGITSKSIGFKSVHSIIMFDLKLRPGVTIQLKPNMEKEKFIDFLGQLVAKTKYKKPKRKLTKEDIQRGYNDYLAEIKADLPQGDMDGNLLDKAQAFFYIMYGIFVAVLVLLSFWGYIEAVYNWFQEKYVEGPLEQKINKELFTGQEKNESAFSHYTDLINFIEFILKGNQPAMIICGKPGLSKTYMLRRTLYFNGMKPRKDYSIEKGASLGLQSTFDLLYINRKRILILDDFDTPLNDPEVVNLLKAVTDSYGKRIISLPREVVKKDYESGGYSRTPSKFEFKGRIIIITNLVRNDINKALISRAPLFEVEYDTKQLITMIEDLLKFICPNVPLKVKQEVFDYVMKLYKYDNKIDISFRAFKGCIDARVGNPMGWKNMIHIILDYKGKTIVESYLKSLN